MESADTADAALTFERMRARSAKREVWAARAGPYSFVIIHDRAGFSARARDHLTAGAQPEELGAGPGAFRTFDDAVFACCTFWRERRN